MSDYPLAATSARPLGANVGRMADPLLTRTRDIADAFLSSINERPVFPPVAFQELVGALGGPLQDQPIDAVAVIEQLAAAAGPGLVATPGQGTFAKVAGSSFSLPSRPE